MAPIYVGGLVIIGPDKGVSPARHEAITWTNVDLMSVGQFWTYYSEILIKI